MVNLVFRSLPACLSIPQKAGCAAVEVCKGLNKIQVCFHHYSKLATLMQHIRKVLKPQLTKPQDCGDSQNLTRKLVTYSSGLFVVIGRSQAGKSYTPCAVANFRFNCTLKSGMKLPLVYNLVYNMLYLSPSLVRYQSIQVDDRRCILNLNEVLSQTRNPFGQALNGLPHCRYLTCKIKLSPINRSLACC